MQYPKPQHAHFVVGLRYRAFPGETATQRRDRRAKERAILLDTGMTVEHYFMFWPNDPEGKSKAKEAAEAKAAFIKNEVGVEMSVCEGCFL